MSECSGQDCPAEEHKPEFREVTLGDVQAIGDQAAKEAETPKVPAVKMQHVFITLADGRRGVFMGPELIKAVEFKLGVVPRPVAIDFEPPREFSVPVPRTEEPVNADQKTDEKPAAGLE